mmetsp:Transcript_13547/g.41133  ORF Transcript_13547/g.41133 Transcript_13547/m.41133 type:complete len:242 (-) Transcript_13547:241-966(-)
MTKTRSRRYSFDSANVSSERRLIASSEKPFGNLRFPIGDAVGILKEPAKEPQPIFSPPEKTEIVAPELVVTPAPASTIASSPDVGPLNASWIDRMELIPPKTWTPFSSPLPSRTTNAGPLPGHCNVVSPIFNHVAPNRSYSMPASESTVFSANVTVHRNPEGRGVAGKSMILKLLEVSGPLPRNFPGSHSHGIMVVLPAGALSTRSTLAWWKATETDEGTSSSHSKASPRPAAMYISICGG